MKFCRLVNKKNAITNAMRLLRCSKRSVHATMDIQSEIDSPLPKKYHALITRRAKHGIHIYRYVYGTKPMFNKIKNNYEGVQTCYGGSMNRYQRMLIIDKKMGMLGLGGNIFLTQFEPLIKSLLDYAKIK